MSHKFLVIQTAFTGDVVLATAVIEKLHQHFPDARIDFMVRKGNEGLLQEHPFIHHVHVWDKKTNKIANLFGIIGRIRTQKYTHVINLHRFGSSGLVTFLSGARYKAGFDKNPFSFCFTRKVTHVIADSHSLIPVHEIARNQRLIEELTNAEPAYPKLYPSAADQDSVRQFQDKPYICVAPSSVWFTKQFPAEKWISLIDVLPADHNIFLLGAPSDARLADGIARGTKHPGVTNLCGRLSFLQSAALMAGARMNYANDSAPLHFASAMNAPVTAVFCSTVPAFGFGPLHQNGKVVEVKQTLTCRPCGLHGQRSCPEGHFKCALDITNEQLTWWISKAI